MLMSIKFMNHSGEIKAVLFGYACHNTTLTGNNYLINGDYAGFAQIEIEKKTRYMKLTPLGSKFARELANKGKELANQEIKRLSRLRLI